LGIAHNLRILGLLLLGVAALPAQAQNARQITQPAPLKYLQLNEPDAQILSYRYQASAAEVRLQGTKRAPKAHIKLKIGSRPGFVELDINRGAISGLEPAQLLGKDFLTYVLWAVSADGRASNLGEITFNGQNPVSINVTTPYQTFWLMVTAEPDYAVADPSPMVVLYSVGLSGGEETSEKRAQRIDGNLAYYTHYTSYDDSPNSPEPAPNELLQARKALGLAVQSGNTPGERRGATGSDGENRISAALELSGAFLMKAEAAFSKDPKGSDVVQFSRTSSQIAENARALSVGAVGDVAIRRLEDEVRALQFELKQFEAEKAKPPVALSSSSPSPPSSSSPSPSISSQVRTPDESLSRSSPPEVASVTAATDESIVGKAKHLASQPITWLGLAGWALVILLLFRKPSV
jgi:hypothetical protein